MNSPEVEKKEPLSSCPDPSAPVLPSMRNCASEEGMSSAAKKMPVCTGGEGGRKRNRMRTEDERRKEGERKIHERRQKEKERGRLGEG